jgi:hypothetical protein
MELPVMCLVCADLGPTRAIQDAENDLDDDVA